MCWFVCIYICEQMGAVYVMIWGLYVHVSDYRHLCGAVFVLVFLLECLQDGNVQISVQSPIYMYTVPSSGHQKKASPNLANKSRI